MAVTAWECDESAFWAAGTLTGTTRYAVARGATLPTHLVNIPARLACTQRPPMLHLPTGPAPTPDSPSGTSCSSDQSTATAHTAPRTRPKTTPINLIHGIQLRSSLAAFRGGPEEIR